MSIIRGIISTFSGKIINAKSHQMQKSLAGIAADFGAALKI